MKILIRRRMSAVLLAAVALCFRVPGAHARQSAPAPAVDMNPVQPESVGFSSARLERLHAFLQQAAGRKEVAGIVTILARHGKVVDYRAYGVRDLDTKAPMTTDTIFRDYSMTKPVTGVAMMILYEEGKWQPSDPISKFIPEFANLRVFTGFNGPGQMELALPDHPPTMRELMTHTAGFTYGDGDTPVDRMYGELKVRQSKDLQQFIDRMAQIPLAYQPGTRWIYSLSMDIQGYIVEKLTGQSLPDFLRDQIFTPLGMRDAGFYVPVGKRSRFATLYENNGHDGLAPDSTNGRGMGDYSKQPTAPSGGGGMVSTAEDYYRFAQMLANGGELGGVRILAPSTVKLMTSNHLPPSLLTGEYRIGSQHIRPGFGYGYNCAVVYDPATADLSDGKGTFLWDGAAGTWFWVDPANDIVFVGMIQRMRGGEPNLEYISHDLVYQALIDPSK
jgi:CubicO group peptidase (beta-lactamase class C family)